MSDPIVPPETDFVLDDRSVPRLLQELAQYSRALPPVTQGGTGTWETVLFGPEHERDAVLRTLAQLATGPEQADGQLPVAQTVVLAMLKLLDTPRRLINQLPEQLRDLYYRDYLGMLERVAQPDRVMLSAVLEDACPELVMKAGLAFDGGQDSEGTARVYRLDQTCTVNHARCTDLRWCIGSQKARVARVLFDEAAGQAWPSGGVRLFAPAPQSILPELSPDEDRPVRAARIVTLVQLDPPGDRTLPELVVTFADNIDSSKLHAEVSAGGHWVKNKNAQPDPNNFKKITFSFEQADLEPAAASKLDGLTTSMPLVRLSLVDGGAVPDVQAISCIAPKVGAVTYTPNAFEQSVRLPFGYARQISPPYDGDELYLGIRSIEPDQLLSLHWQLRSPQQLVFDECSYLAQDAQGGHWEPLDDALIDGTNGWYTSGVWSLSWPHDALDTAQIESPLQRRMPPGRYWLRVRVKSPAREPSQAASMPAYPWAHGLHTNALSATLAEPQTIDAAHFKQPLPAGTIVATVDSVDGLQRVLQPWPSAGGRAAETRAAWIARVSARLRHRERALTDWDIGRLLRDYYPGIRDLHLAESRVVRAMQHRARQTIVLMPRASTNDNGDPLRPAFSQAHLNEMRDWLAQRASPWLQITCCNPDYVPVQVRWSVTFAPGISRALGNQQIQQALHTHYLAWSTSDVLVSLIGQPLAYHEMMRVIQACDVVQHVDSLTLNGREDSVDAADTEVLVPVFASPEYAQVKLAFYREQLAGAYWQRAVIYGNGRNQVEVACVIPKKLTLAGAGQIDIDDQKVFLYDCDTGKRLDVQGSPAGPSCTNQTGQYCLPVQVASKRDTLPTKDDLWSLHRYVQADQIVGRYRIGVGADVPLSDGRTYKLRSHDAGLELGLQVLPKVDYAAPENWLINTLPPVPLAVATDAQVSVELGTYVLQANTLLVGPAQLTLMPTLPTALTSQELSKAWGTAIKMLSDEAPHAITVSDDAIHCWWVGSEPSESSNSGSPESPIKRYGIKQGATIEIPLGEHSQSISFGDTDIVFSPVPCRQPMQWLTIYGLHIRSKQTDLAISGGIEPYPMGTLDTGVPVAHVTDSYGNEGTVHLAIQRDRPEVKHRCAQTLDEHSDNC
ncbi:unnamed protein product [Mycetohabitans rhizoxinica HKI 454]|uniref:Baseplate protein J-like domain-containing protein n=1 Tax=Mycetohabitans rhizoxinica (strain DSM 19002 / CIP 109453 / HKI 454) TaxID=882378 RepID=E5ARQ3_MYCRK|nr:MULTISPECIES: hypothetical protein [Mycetohabitans]MCG1047315.1 hypothetical protein [Mycetohabitans sp. B6]CBW75285.1 unnamed protein product [Mycetohabitans rhizoxinica HKI 454]